MNLLEKYISKQAQKPAKRSLLHTYLISLMSLCLTVTMLLGTTMAWFTTSVDVPNNEIYVGTLKVDLLMQVKEANGDIKRVSLKPVESAGAESPRVFDSSIMWYPGHAEVRTLIVEDQGEIPFTYRLNITAMRDSVKAPVSEPAIDSQTDAEQPLDDQTLMEFLRQFEVYTKADDADAFRAEDLLNSNEWTYVGTMDKLFSDEQDVNTYTNAAGDSEKPGELEVFRGSSEHIIDAQTGAGDEADPDQQRCAVHSVAIKMSENADISEEFDFRGYTLNFGIKLVASQIGSPESINTAKELADRMAAGYSVTIPADISGFELEQPVLHHNTLLSGWIDENGTMPSLEISDQNASDAAVYTTGGTIRYLSIEGRDYTSSQAVVTGTKQDSKLTQNLYIDHVTIDKVADAIAVEGDGKCKVQVTNSRISGAISCENVSGADFVSCELGETNNAYGSMTICGNTTFTGCDFKEFTLKAGQMPEKTTVTFTNCTVNGEKVAVDVLMKLLNINGEQGNDWSKCTFIIDGITRTVG